MMAVSIVSLKNGSKIMRLGLSNYLDSIDDNEYSKETHQPCVPIQFIWCEGQLHPACDASNIAFTGDSCEQIGAVLYVRDEE